MPNTINAESQSVNSILNDDNLSVEQKRVLLEERMANLPEEQRKELEALKQMDKLDYATMGIAGAMPSVIKKILPSTTGFLNRAFGKHLQGLSFGLRPLAKNPIVKGFYESTTQPIIKEGILKSYDAVKSIPQDVQDNTRVAEYELWKLMTPKIPHVDY